METILFGDSHISGYYRLAHNSAVGTPAATMKCTTVWVDNGLIAYKFMLETSDGRIRNPIVDIAFANAGILDRYTNSFIGDTASKRLIFLIGSAENHISGFNSEWMKFGVSGSARANAGYLLPPAVIKEAVLARLDTFRRCLIDLRKLGFSIDILGGPPPTFDNAFIMQRNQLSSLPKPETRLAIYECVCAALSEIATQVGGAFISTSPYLANSDGFLREQFTHDGIHANDLAAFTVMSGLQLLTLSEAA